MSKSNLQESKGRMHVSEAPGPDFTTYESKDAKELVSFLPDIMRDGKEIKDYSYPISIPCEYKTEIFESRALICKSYGGEFWSLTLRCDVTNSRPVSDGGYLSFIKSGLDEFVKGKLTGKNGITPSQEELYRNAKLKHFLGYCPGGHPSYSALVNKERADKDTKKDEPLKGDAPVYLNEIYTICRALYERLFEQAETSSHHSGLIVITGATDSSKSLITRGLIFLYLEQAARQAREARQRKPHLLTYEDPIEQFFIIDPTTKTAPKTVDDLKSLLEAVYVDYTPREKNADVDSLKRVTKDALRQTPAVLFVGETREEDDWKELLQFAGSGHLVITTSHASSVTEAMSGIFRDTETKTPAQRSEAARRIMGIINIRSFTPSDTDVRALVPALWNRTPQTINNLTADGLASMVPSRDGKGNIGYYGRVFFADKLIDKLLITDEMADYSDKDKALEEIKKTARKWDIKGV